MFNYKKENDKPSILFQGAFNYISGGVVGVIGGGIVGPFVYEDPTSVKEMFIRMGYETTVSKYMHHIFEEHMKEQDTPSERWKIGVAAGLVVGATNAVITTIRHNGQKYQKKKEKEGKQKEGKKKKCSLKNLVEMAKEEGISSLFDGYLSQAVGDSLFSAGYGLVGSYNHLWMDKKFKNVKSPIINQVVLPMARGALNGLEATLLTRPIAWTARNLLQKGEVDPQRVVEKTWEDLKFLTADIAIEVMLFGQVKKLLIPAHNLAKKLI
ncbi:glycine transporter [Anaeramoeba flamelloides]|uniref:Glycine transporter n=1 Tax=Anaeramoeba flamelloides TaxID=1746091 RepID=A0ABQ8YQV2_9EUKA|nr:glycine transporter [Anaeramoeba flamelloides]